MQIDDFDSDEDDGRGSTSTESRENQGEKKAHHNALERKRRDHIKDSFLNLKDYVPSLVNERASRSQILKKACDYIELMQTKISQHEKDIDELKNQNTHLESQIHALESASESMLRCSPPPTPTKTSVTSPAGPARNAPIAPNAPSTSSLRPLISPSFEAPPPDPQSNASTSVTNTCSLSSAETSAYVNAQEIRVLSEGSRDLETGLLIVSEVSRDTSREPAVGRKRAAEDLFETDAKKARDC